MDDDLKEMSFGCEVLAKIRCYVPFWLGCDSFLSSSLSATHRIVCEVIETTVSPEGDSQRGLNFNPNINLQICDGENWQRPYESVREALN